MAGKDKDAVARVAAALAAAGLNDRMVKISSWRRRSDAPVSRASAALKVPAGAIAQTYVVLVGDTPALAIVAGDQTCRFENMPRALNLEGDARLGSEQETATVTGYAAGVVAPVGLPSALPSVLDRSLKRFETVYCFAGDPNRLFSANVEELKRLTGCIVSWNLASPEAVAQGRAR